MAGGHPTDYNPIYCERVLAWGEQGKSKAWMAARIGVVRQTLENWAQAHPEFMDAFTRSQDLAQGWWEDAGQNHMISRPSEASINTGVWSRSMAARFPADWREKTETTHEVKGPIPLALNGSDVHG